MKIPASYKCFVHLDNILKINKDVPIVEIADFGLASNLFKRIPELEQGRGA